MMVGSRAPPCWNTRDSELRGNVCLLGVENSAKKLDPDFSLCLPAHAIECLPHREWLSHGQAHGEPPALRMMLRGTASRDLEIPVLSGMLLSDDFHRVGHCLEQG